MRKWYRLTALVLAFAIVLSTVSGALAQVEVDYSEYLRWVEEVKAANGLAGVISIDEGGEVLVEPSTFNGVTNAGPQYTTETTQNLGTYAADSAPTIDVALEQYGKATLAAPAAGQWQVYLAAADLWVNITGETGSTFELTFAKVQSLFAANGHAQLRCLMGDKATETVNVGMSYSLTALPSSIKEDSATLIAAKSSNDGIAVAADTPELNEYSVVINYVFENNYIVADPYTATLAAGSNFSATVTFPTVQGYLPYLNEVQQNSLTLNIEDIQADVTYRVTYKPTNVDYTVIHYQQNVDNDKYTIKETETIQGLTKSTVPEVAKSYEGFYALLYEKPEIAADGSTVVEIYYDRYYYLMTFDLGGGYGVEPIYARFGSTIANVGTPIRAGYTFNGWSLDGVDAELPGTMPAKNRTYVAKWTVDSTAKVTIVFWGENANNEEYSYISSSEIYTTPGTSLTYNESGSRICGQEEHTHSSTCGYACNMSEHSHDQECYTLTCTQEDHAHTEDCYDCGLESHTHGTGCYSGVGSAFSASLTEHRVSGTQTNGSIGQSQYNFFGWNNTGTPYIYINGTWYAYSGDTAIGGTASPICGKTEAQHSHTEACLGCGKESHEHTNYSGTCYTLTCTIAAHLHGDACGYNCAKTAHTHTSDCYMSGAGMDSNLWTFVKSDTVTVAADGSSVINVYYDRTQKTLTFKYDYSNRAYRSTETITAKWGEDISDEYVAIANNAGTTFWAATDSSGGPYTNYFGVMPQTSATYYNRGSSGSNGTMRYYGEALDGTYEEMFSVGGVGGYSVTVEDRYEFEGFTYSHGTSTGSSCSGAAFYYTRNSYTLTFNDGYDDVNSQSVKYEAPLSTYKDYEPGYPVDGNGDPIYEPGSVTFDGWYLNPECTGNEYDLSAHTMPAENVLLYAKWVPVNHTVEFYLDLDALNENTKIGSTYPDLTVAHGAKVETVPAEPTNPKGAYTFVGWFYLEDGAEKAFDFKNMPINKDMKVYGKWSSNVLKNYFVYFKIQGTDTQIADPITGSALAGHTKTFEAKGGTDLYTNYQEGYFPLVQSHSMTLDIEDETQNTFTFYYVQKEAVPYTVYYVAETLKDGGTSLGTIERDGKTYYIIADTYTNSENRKAVVTEKFKTVSGYMPDAYQKRLVVDGTDGAVNEIIFFYSVDTTHAYYKITHYTQNTDGEHWTEYASSEAVGNIGDTYTASPLTISGFTYDSSVAGTLVSGELTVNGLELKLYYVRNPYPYQVRYLEQGTGKKLAEPKDGSGLYGAVVSESAIDIANYTAVDPTSQTLTIKIEERTEAKLNIITFYYTENDAIINYVVVGPTGCGTVQPTTETVKAVIGYAEGSTASVSSSTYKFVGWFKDENCNQPVDADWVDENDKIVPEQPGRVTTDDGVTNGLWPETTTYYAKFDWNVADLTIVKTGLDEDTTPESSNPEYSDNESAIFTVVGDYDGDGDVDTFTVIIPCKNGRGQKTLTGICVGEYTVTELTDWTWRYDTTTYNINGGTEATGNVAEVNVEGGVVTTVTFTNAGHNGKWLGGDNYTVNTFSK